MYLLKKAAIITRAYAHAYFACYIEGGADGCLATPYRFYQNGSGCWT